MPTATCKCGRLTNSAVSNYWETDGHPTECLVAVENNVFVKGCAWHTIPPGSLSMYEKYLGQKAVKTREEMRASLTESTDEE